MLSAGSTLGSSVREPWASVMSRRRLDGCLCQHWLTARHVVLLCDGESRQERQTLSRGLMHLTLMAPSTIRRG